MQAVGQPKTGLYPPSPPPITCRYRLITEAEHNAIRSPRDRCDYYKTVDGIPRDEPSAGAKGAACNDAERNPDLAMEVGTVHSPLSRGYLINRV
jgi:hypothetical protein